jgi:predicted site-specific integrase-resolvase
MRRWHRPDLEEGWADRRRTAEMLGITVRTLLRWHQQGKGPLRQRNGNGLRYRISEIEDWLSLNPRHRATNPALPDAA